MMQKPPTGDFSAWQKYWVEQGKLNREKCDRMAEIIRAMKTCSDGEFENLAVALRAINTDDSADVIGAIRNGRSERRYNNAGSESRKKKWT